MSVENVVESVECFPQGNMGGREQEETDMVMRWKRMREGAQAPQRQTEGSAGFDLQACVEAPVTLQPGDSYRFPRDRLRDPPGLRGVDLYPQRPGL